MPYQNRSDPDVPGIPAPANPWDRWRHRRESNLAYAAFLDYRDSGVRRGVESLLKRYREMLDKHNADPQKNRPPPTASGITIKHWTVLFDWTERAQAWDAYQSKLREDELAEARRQWMERERDIGLRLMEKAMQMVQFPLTETTREDGGRTIIIRPNGWGIQSVGSVAAMASDLFRRGAEMGLDRYGMRLAVNTLTGAVGMGGGNIGITEVVVELPTENQVSDVRSPIDKPTPP